MGFSITILCFMYVLILLYLTTFFKYISLFNVVVNELEILYKDPAGTILELLSGEKKFF
jgi:hypothetical protein